LIVVTKSSCRRYRNVKLATDIPPSLYRFVSLVYRTEHQKESNINTNSPPVVADLASASDRLLSTSVPTSRAAFPAPSGYPDPPAARDRWILARRPPRPRHDLAKPQGAFIEDECAASGAIAPVLTVLLTSRECPWRCLMCDLWRFTVTQDIPPGVIPAQIQHALHNLPPGSHPRQVKLYNAGSFFDPRAVPPVDDDAIAAQLARFERVIVECHPALVGPRCRRFRDRLAAHATAASAAPPALEVAMGLETAHPAVLAKLNKRMTLDQFRRAADFLCERNLALRVFILVQPPFLPAEAAVEWSVRSAELAFDCGATAATLIPTRAGNGALDALAAAGEFTPPRLATLEAALKAGIALRRGRVFADVWDLERFADCAVCFPARAERLRQMNLTQRVLPRVVCAACGG
jgi:radical SAM enzyme (TIGR01210 family)